MTTSYYRSWI